MRNGEMFPPVGHRHPAVPAPAPAKRTHGEHQMRYLRERSRCFTVSAAVGCAAWVAGIPAVPAQDVSGDRSGDETLAEIVVTATRQERALSRVPVSVAAFDQAAMEQKGVKSFEDIVRFTPGVDFNPDGNEISIRGISSGAGAGTTGIYIDDTPIQM